MIDLWVLIHQCCLITLPHPFIGGSIESWTFIRYPQTETLKYLRSSTFRTMGWEILWNQSWFRLEMNWKTASSKQLMTWDMKYHNLETNCQLQQMKPSPDSTSLLSLLIRLSISSSSNMMRRCWTINVSWKIWEKHLMSIMPWRPKLQSRRNVSGAKLRNLITWTMKSIRLRRRLKVISKRLKINRGKRTKIGRRSSIQRNLR
jgi:hypothetical protein